jgi:NDP-sugar pyrophosphorylase family protein
MAFGVHLTGFVLAAGEGKRLRPVTLERPKALVPFCGVPMLELAAARLAELPVDELVVNAWYKADAVAQFCTGLEGRLGRHIRVSREPQLLDTGGGLRHGLRELPQAEHVIVHNADIVLDCDLRRLVEFHLENNAAATVLLVPNRGPRTVELGPDGRIRAFRRPRGEGGYTFSGVHIFRRDVLQFLPSAEVCSIVTAYEAAIAAGLPVFGVSTRDAWWSDLGNPTDYIMAHGEVADRGIRHFTRLREAQAEQARRRAELEMRRGVRCTGAIGLGADLIVPAGAQLHNVVLWDGTRLPSPSLYADAVFTGGPV